MTNEAKQTDISNPAVSEPQVEASECQLPQQLALEDKKQLSQENPETGQKADERAPPFAHDINYKLDELELDISALTDKFKSSQGTLGNALGDLKSRTAAMTLEISSVADQLEQSDDAKRALITSLEDRLRDATALLSEQLDSVDAQLEKHHDSISKLRKDLSLATDNLEGKLENLRQDTQAKLHTLYENQARHDQTQKAFTEYLDDLQGKSNTTADDLYKLNTDFSEEKRLVSDRFKLLSGVSGALLFTLAAFMAYFHWGDSAQSRDLDLKVETLSSNLASKETVSNLSEDLNRQMASVENALSASQAIYAQEHTAVSESLEDIAAKVAAIQLSLYGPADNAVTLPSPKLTIHNTEWINKQNQNHYSIQLVGVYRETAMIDFANRYAGVLGDHPLASSISEYRGQNWFNLVYGNFESFREAQTVLDDLPAGIQKNSPWIRSIGSIQKNRHLNESSKIYR